MNITLTHYTAGKGAPFYPISEEPYSVEEAMADMFCRLKADAILSKSGFNYGLFQSVGPEDNPTGSDETIYGGLPLSLQVFLTKATQWNIQQGQPGTLEHQQYIRHQLINAIQPLSAAETEVALSMAEDQFLATMALAIETGEDISLLFQ